MIYINTLDKNKIMPFGNKNYRTMLLGIALLVVGFVIMSLDNEPFGFGFMGLTLGPIIVMTGFITEIIAILQKPE